MIKNGRVTGGSVRLLSCSLRLRVSFLCGPEASRPIGLVQLLEVPWSPGVLGSCPPGSVLEPCPPGSALVCRSPAPLEVPWGPSCPEALVSWRPALLEVPWGRALLEVPRGLGAQGVPLSPALLEVPWGPALLEVPRSPGVLEPCPPGSALCPGVLEPCPPGSVLEPCPPGSALGPCPPGSALEPWCPGALPSWKCPGDLPSWKCPVALVSLSPALLEVPWGPGVLEPCPPGSVLPSSAQGWWERASVSCSGHRAESAQAAARRGAITAAEAGGGNQESAPEDSGSQRYSNALQLNGIDYRLLRGEVLQ
ncbi:hypothetical protein NDU88_000632 [Pleurodeles waltl]|uniref:Uncharacterized protein n=1 Tax=Pleurodeles waltl TaxID=8319 RepID=A0AAV7NA72_PLEWA|nr:hypothetical protein NDU88_000632 [Pleurodeles waltl]